MATNPTPAPLALINPPPPRGEAILQHEEREITLLVARDQLTITRAKYDAGQHVAGPHIHHDHTDAFYVLEGELVFEIGHERDTISAFPGDFVAVPPGVAHSFRVGNRSPACWLTLHTPDGGFAAFMRGTRDNINIDWDIAPVPTDSGLPANNASISRRA
jgi:quercetin dioxygenase-like cupin family protein